MNMEYSKDDFEWVFEECVPCTACRAKFAEFWFELEACYLANATKTRWYPFAARQWARGFVVDFAPVIPPLAVRLPKLDIDFWPELAAINGLQYRVLRRTSVQSVCNHGRRRGGLALSSEYRRLQDRR